MHPTQIRIGALHEREGSGAQLGLDDLHAITEVLPTGVSTAEPTERGDVPPFGLIQIPATAARRLRLLASSSSDSWSRLSHFASPSRSRAVCSMPIVKGSSPLFICFLRLFVCLFVCLVDCTKRIITARGADLGENVFVAFSGKMCVFVSRPMKIVTFPWKNRETPTRVVDFLRGR